MFKNDFTSLLKRLSIAVVLSIWLRVMFYLFNMDDFADMTLGEMPNLLRGIVLYDAANISLTFSLFVIISLIPTRRQSGKLFEKLKFWSFTAGVLVMTILNAIDTVYFSYTFRRGIADDLAFADNNNTLSVMAKAASENISVLICAVLTIAVTILWYRHIRYYPTAIKSNPKFYAVGSSLMLLGLFLLFFTFRGSSLSGHPLTIRQASRYVTDPNKVSIVLANPYCIASTMMTPSQQYIEYFTPKELDNTYSPVHTPENGLVMDKKNVVIFILEGFSRENSGYLNQGLYKAGESFTPFLDSLMQRGYTFSNAYANGPGSREAMSSIYNSIPNFKETFMLMPQSMKATESLAGLLGNEGYETMFFNGSERTLMGFEDYARVIGFKKTYSQESYLEKYPEQNYDGRWGIWDEPFLQFMGETISQTPEPFLASVFTITSHHPFVVPEQYRDSLPKGYTEAHQSILYTDMAIAKFFEKFSDTEWFKNTIFVFVADHISPRIYAEKTKTPTGKKSIIHFMYTDDGSLRGESDNVAQQIDIMPTVLGLLKYPKPFFAFGQDAFRKDSTEDYAIFYADGLFQMTTNDGSYLFDESQMTKVYDYKNDSLHLNNIVGQNPAREDEVENRMKAFIQSYYHRLRNSNFKVK